MATTNDAYDEQWFTSLTQILLLGLSMTATLRLYRVFPFDFAGYGLAWAIVVRTVLVLALVGCDRRRRRGHQTRSSAGTPMTPTIEVADV